VLHGEAPLTFALALGVGVLCQVAASHLRTPSIVLLLAAGVVLGPDIANWIDPDALGEGLHAVVQVAVAIILFEGSLNLDLARLRREATAIRRLVLLGAAVTTLGAGLAAYLALGWSATQSLLFGTLVIVTGPTVIRPLLRSVPLRSRLATVLEAEGLLIDPVGAIVAAVAVQIVVSPGLDSVASSGAGLVFRLGSGVLCGLGAGFALAWLLRARRLVPRDARHLVALAGALLTFELSNALFTESGILAVVVAGVVVGNSERAMARELGEFQEHLTVGLIGVLFVLLAAEVRVDQVTALGRGGALTVAALMVVVRPLGVWLCTVGTELSWPEKTFLSWVAPRGVVAAAVASITADALALHGRAGGAELRALVFLTIAVTVAVQGGTAGLVARMLGVGAKGRDIAVILGAGELGLALGEVLRETCERVLFADSNPTSCRNAEERGFPVVYGDVFEPATQSRLRLKQAWAAIALTGNPIVNGHFSEEAKEAFQVPEVYAAMGRTSIAASERHAAKYGGRILFERPTDVQRWDIRIRHGHTETLRGVFAPPEGERAPGAAAAENDDPYLVLAVRHEGRWEPMSSAVVPVAGQEAVLVVHTPEREVALARLAAVGWRIETEATRAPGRSDVVAEPRRGSA
jgi:NhaP-type Na+/H+ or K+/H+ antiporter